MAYSSSPTALRVAPFGLFAQLGLEHLATRISRQWLISYSHVLRDLEVGDALADMREHRVDVKAIDRGHYHGADLLAHHLVRNRYDSGLGDARRAGEGSL